jgi:hypothetical protein
MALGISNINVKKLRRFVITGISILFLVTLVFFYRTPSRENWRGAVAHVDHVAGPGEVLFGDLSTQIMYNYYGTDQYLIILHVKELYSINVAGGWILLRERQYNALREELEKLQGQYALEITDDYYGLMLYHFKK